MLEKDARNFLEKTPYQYINFRRNWSGNGVNGKVARMKLEYFGHVTRRSAGNLALTVLEGSVDCLQQQQQRRHRAQDKPQCPSEEKT